MMICTKKTIQNCPYTSAVPLPPEEPHCNTFFKITFVEHGEADIDFYKKDKDSFITKKVTSGTAHILRPFEVNNYHIKKDTNYCHHDVYADEKLFKECCDSVDSNLFNQILFSKEPFIFEMSGSAVISSTEILSLLKDATTSPEKDRIHKGAIISLLTLAMSDQIKQDYYPLWIKGLLRSIASEDVITLPISEIIKTTHYSHGYVNREFKKYLGMSLKKYVIKEKLSLAATLLATSSISLSEIVDRLSFTTLSNFINVFKEQYKATPAKYRKEKQSRIDLDTYTEWEDFIKK